MAARIAPLRFAASTRASAQFRPQSFRTPFQRRWQTTAADAAPAQSGFSRFWNSPIGPKTVHFWAPVMKWCVVLAGAADFFRPVESLSMTQNLALLSTGAIWTRWCLIIRPRNVALASVNFLLFIVGATQVGRILLFKKDTEGTDGIKQELKQQGEVIEGLVKDPKGAVKNAEKTS